MIRRNLWVLNLLFLFGFSYFVADLVNLFVGQKLEVPLGSQARVGATEPPPEVRPSREIYTSIVERNIFGVNPAGSIASQPGGGVVAPVPLPPLRIRLIGTVVGERDDSLAVIEDLATSQQSLFRLQDFVQGEARLVAISRNEVVIQRRGAQETFYVEEGPASAVNKPAQSRVASQRSALRPTRPSNNRILDKREVEAALGNLPLLLTKARVVPNLGPDGKNNGFRIVSISPSSFYEKIGLQNGDILQRINGIDVRDPATFMQIFTQLKTESSISLDLLRNNRKESFTYEIR